MSPRVSVIVPAYQAQDHLEECLKSLTSQTLREMEVLLIDDGSTDGTGAIAARWAEKDERVRLLALPENRGVSAARNLGLAHAQGEYIGFCDADDRALPEMYETLYEAAREADADVSFCGVVKERKAGPEQVPLLYSPGTVLDREAIRQDLLPGMISLPIDGEALPISGYTPRNLFRRDLLSDVRFREEIHYAEDLLFITQALLGAGRVVVAPGLLYIYRFHGASATKKYMPDLSASYDACHRALIALFRAQGMEEAMTPRMEIRERRAALSLVANENLPGTPHGFFARVGRVREILNRPDTRRLFLRLPLSALPLKLRVKYACAKYRWALPLTFFYSFVYRAY